ncbi:hypothetical protein [Catenuloplanes indicus]|uniref:Uncharacterized protein n=1 Tax=Catenuloplanes indicus TaxID=137267 RepID=A0AAE3VUW1_9ACTN|nr:hypothetical protein [Catenuloplanes indicus]MDQ0364166.1 hypothetical protein [Catenuloplanes indicus]
MAARPAPWWKQVDDAAALIASAVNAAAARAGRDGTYSPPRGSPPPRRRRRAASLRHLAEVIRTYRMAPGRAVDKDDVAGVLAGDLRHLTDPVTVVAVARASHRIAGVPFGADDARRLTVAVDYLNALLAAAHEADRRAPDLLPVPRPAAALLPWGAHGRGQHGVDAEELDADGLGAAGPGAAGWDSEGLSAGSRYVMVPIAARPPDPPGSGASSRWARLRPGPASWAALVAIFATGVVVGVTGSRLAEPRTVRGASDIPASATAPATATDQAGPVRPACLPPGAAKPSGAMVMGPPGVPETVSPNWWPNNPHLDLSPTDTGFVAAVPADSVTPSDLMGIRSGITIIKDHRYRFDFTVSGDRRRDILRRIQDNESPEYRESLTRNVPVGPVPCRLSYTFTAAATSQATGEVTFQLGGKGAYRVTVEDAVLVELSV